MNRKKLLLSCTALAVGTLLAFSAGASETQRQTSRRTEAKQPAAPKDKKATATPKPPTYRCRVGNGKGAHYVDSAYPCSSARGRR